MSDLVRAGAFAISMFAAALAPAAQPTRHGATTMHVASFAEHEARCAGKDGWSDPAPPVRIYGNVYDVGTCGITVLLVTSPNGLVMIDGATAEAVPSIIANVRQLGVQPSDVKFLLSSHPHVDHAGGLAELRRLTGARLAATAASRPALESGTAPAEDPQSGGLPAFEGVHVDRLLRDGDAVALGTLRLTVHATPGHAPGSTSWSWRSCDRAGCHDIVYADSLSAVSAGTYRYADHPASVATFRASMAKIEALRCDLVITPHPGASDLYDRLAGKKPLADRRACANYAIASAAVLDRRLAQEAAGSGVLPQ